MAEALRSAAPITVPLRKPDTRLFGADTVLVDGVEYSRADFEPVPESLHHYRRCGEAFHALLHEFDSRPGDAFVAADINVYYDQQDQQRAVVAPDIMVALGVPQWDRIRYRVWEEGRPPSFVLEVLSSSTWRNDIGDKKAVYARMGVREYFVLDGEDKHMRAPRLRGFRLRPGAIPVYDRIPPWSAAESMSRGAELGYWCETLALGIALLPGQPGARFYDPKTRDYLPTATEDHVTSAEQRVRADKAEARADDEQALRLHEQALRLQAQARADKAEAQRREALARLAELESRLKGD